MSERFRFRLEMTEAGGWSLALPELRVSRCSSDEALWVIACIFRLQGQSAAYLPFVKPGVEWCTRCRLSVGEFCGRYCLPCEAEQGRASASLFRWWTVEPVVYDDLDPPWDLWSIFRHDRGVLPYLTDGEALWACASQILAASGGRLGAFGDWHAQRPRPWRKRREIAGLLTAGELE